MDIQQLKYFLALAKELHFWKTAEKMNITQSALSRHIMSLENELGLQLFLEINAMSNLLQQANF